MTRKLDAHPMRVLIIPSWYPSREAPLSGIFFKEQAEALARRGLEVEVLHVIAGFHTDTTKIVELHRSREKGVRTTIVRMSLPVRKSLTLNRIEFTVFILCYLLFIRRKPDIIHAHAALRGGMWAVRLATILNRPVVITEHETSYLRGLYSEGTLVNIKALFGRADAVVAVSPFFADKLAEITGFDRSRILYIPNLVDTDYFRLSPYQKSRKSWNLSIVCLLTEKKRVDIAIDACAILRDRGIPVLLTIAGDGSAKAALQERVADKGLTATISFAGSMDRSAVRALLHTSDIFLSTSDVETFGVTLIEAMSCGLPVASTDSGGPSVIVGERNGILTPCGDAIAFADAVQSIIENYDHYDRIAIRNECIEKFGLHAVTGAIASLYKHCIGNGVDV